MSELAAARRISPSHLLFPLLALATLHPAVPSGLALVLGMALALSLGNPYLQHTGRMTKQLLSLAVIGLGTGMDLRLVARAGLHGMGYTVIGITACLGIGHLLTRRLGLSKHIGMLISFGTAICGGSAIAAAAPVLRAKDHDVSVAMATVFLLNAVALFVFPSLGHWAALDPPHYGLFAALAIHDTSSVVGAALQYGGDALQVGASVKLARSLWIAPVVLVIGALERKSTVGSAARAPRPWFILGFILAAALVTFIPALQPVGAITSSLAQRAFVVTLFLVGTGITREALRKVGARPLLLGVTLWVTVTSLTLGALRAGWIS
ncbi:MAG: putative sulfate exporter family transporter [Myxococcaceae bacterium]